MNGYWAKIYINQPKAIEPIIIIQNKETAYLILDFVSFLLTIESTVQTNAA